jgi:4-cresol dehydrogenase (hydroxylating) flavoprotein subunit
MRKNLSAAIQEWRKVLTTKRVIVDQVSLTNEGTATFKTKQKVLAVLKPRSTKEVAVIMQIASKHRVPVYPVSGGKNWGLGSKVPEKDGVLIDLANMKKITAYDEKMGYMSVQPGVTFRAAVDFLKQKKSSLMVDTIGSTPDATIVGNTAERGHGMAMYADRFNFVCALEIVLPDGKIVKTGFADFKKSKLGPLAKWGVGPYIDGLFTQSNFGIITSLTLWLKAQPKHFTSFIFHVDDEKKLAAIMDAWRQLGLDGLQSSLRVFNDMRMIAFGERFPEAEKTPLSENARRSIRKKLNIGKWIGLGGLYPPSDAHALADQNLIQSRIGHLVDKLTFFDQEKIDTTYHDAAEPARAQMDFMFNKTLLRGNVSEAAINMTYWRKPSTVKVKDVHQDKAGVIWYCPAIPMRGADALQAIRISTRISKKYGFELNLGFLFISQRTLDITGAICYDREVPGEDQRAMACHNELMRVLGAKGYSPYRLGIQSMLLMQGHSPNMRKLLADLKRSVDPNDILAPGHYLL